MSKFSMDDYVDVAERIRQFYDRFPDGSLKSGSAPQLIEVGGKPFITYHAQAYRTPDDPCPADGWAWEPVPGPTQFTKDSELMNAETAAWGRAIVACGFETKKIASRQEVQNRETAAPAAGPSPAGNRDVGAADALNAVVARLKELDTVSQWDAILDARARDEYREPGGLAGLKPNQRQHLAGKLTELANGLAEASAGEPQATEASLDANGTGADAASSPAEQSPFQIPAKAKA